MGEQQQYDQVGFDDFNGTLQATRHLIAKGHRQIVFAGDISYPWLHRRFEGYQQGMRENKLKPALILTRNAQSFVDFGQKSVERILSRRPRPTAAVAGNDEIAYGLWRSLQRHAMKVPDDISLVGFDDREEALLMDPPLSTVRVRKDQMGDIHGRGATAESTSPAPTWQAANWGGSLPTTLGAKHGAISMELLSRQFENLPQRIPAFDHNNSDAAEPGMNKKAASVLRTPRYTRR